MQLTPNYNLKKPEGTDPVDIQDFNDNADILDAELNKKADSAGGDISNMTIKALEEPAGTQFPVPEAGETSKSFLGKIRKFMNDFKSWNTGVCMIGQIVNNCVTNNDKLPLSAAQGKVLMDLYSVLNTNLKQKLEYIKRPEASASLSSAIDQDNNAFLSFSANKAITLLKFWNDRHVTIDHSADNGTTWTGGKILTSADFRIVRASGKTMSGSNIVTATVPGLQSGKACVVTCNTTTANHILCAAAIAENTLEVRFANNFDGVATAWISVAFIP